MPETFVTKLQLKILWQKAKKEGFTAESLRRMLNLLNLDPKNMSDQEFTTLMLYVNAVNAKKFSY